MVPRVCVYINYTMKVEMQLYLFWRMHALFPPLWNWKKSKEKDKGL